MLINCKFRVILDKLWTHITYEQDAEYFKSPKFLLELTNEDLNSDPPKSNNN